MANFGDVQTDLDLAALESFRRNAGDSLFEAFVPAEAADIFWLRDTVGSPFLHPETSGDDLEIDGEIRTGTINEIVLNDGIIIDQLRIEDKTIYFDTNTYLAGTTSTMSFTTIGNTRLSIDQTAGEVYVNAILSVSDRLGTAVGTPVASKGFIYMDSADDKLYFKNSTTTFELTDTGGAGDVSASGTPLDDQIAVWTNATTIEGSTALSFTAAGGLIVTGTGAITAKFTSTNALYTSVVIDGGSSADNILTFNVNGTPAYSMGADAGTGTLRIVKGGGDELENLEDGIVFNDDGPIELYRNDEKVFETIVGGIALYDPSTSVPKISFADSNTQVWLQSGEMYFKDGTAGTHTLEDLSTGSGLTFLWARTTGTPNYLSPDTSGDWVYTDGGFHFDGVDGVISADDGTASDGYSITIQAGDPVGATNDGGSVTLKAGDALSADSGSTPGAVYLMPGSPWQTSTVSQVYLGDSTYNADTVGIQATGSQTDVNLAISTKGDGSISILADDIDLWNMRVYEFISDMIITTASTYDLKLVGGAGSTDQPGRDIHIESGQGNGTGDGGNLYMYRGPAGVSGTVGDLYFGDGSGGALTNDEAETNVVGYDTSTGQLTYRSAAGVGSSTFIGLSDTPADWTGGVGGYLVMVDSTPDAVEFIDPTTITLNTWEDTLDGALAILGSPTNPVSIRVPHTSTGSTQIQMFDGQEIWFGAYTSTTYSGFFAVHGASAQSIYIAVSFSGGQKRFDIDATSMRIQDAEDEIGLQYAADYSTNGIALGDRWIPDKGYVDSVAGAPWGTATSPYVVIGSSPGDIQSSIALTFDATTAVMKLEGGSGDLPEFYLRNNAGSNYRMHMIATSPPTCYLEVVHASGKLELIAGGGIAMPDYGDGTFTGTPTYTLQVDTDGNIIEGAVTGGLLFGSDNEIPYTNSGGTNYDYSDTFTYDGTSLYIDQSHTSVWTVTATPTDTILIENSDTSTLANKYSAITFESHAASGNTNLSSIVSLGPTASSDSTYMYFMGTDASSNWLTGLGIRFGVDIFMYDHHTAAAWVDYPTGLPSRSMLIQRSTAAGDITGDYSGILMHAKPTAGQNSYGFLGVEAIGGANHSTRFNMLLRGTGSSDYETVFSADYNSIYRWKANSTSRDIIHHLESNSTTVCVLGWDAVGTAGFQIHTGTGFQGTTAAADFVINTSGYLFLGNLQNVTNTNYIRYNSTTGECTWLSSSDISLKKNIKSWEPDSLDFLMNLGVIRFDRKDKSCYDEIGWNGTLMEELMPDMTWRDDKNLVNIKDAHFPFHFHRAIQQLGEKVEVLETLEQRVSRLELENVDLRKQLLNIKNNESN